VPIRPVVEIFFGEMGHLAKYLIRQREISCRDFSRLEFWQATLQDNLATNHLPQKWWRVEILNPFQVGLHLSNSTVPLWRAEVKQ
jgi:hypothetical protein